MSKLKNGTQRVLAALLSLCMLLAVLPGAALAEEADHPHCFGTGPSEPGGELPTGQLEQGQAGDPGQGH